MLDAAALDECLVASFASPPLPVRSRDPFVGVPKTFDDELPLESFSLPKTLGSHGLFGINGADPQVILALDSTHDSARGSSESERSPSSNATDVTGYPPSTNLTHSEESEEVWEWRLTAAVTSVLDDTPEQPAAPKARNAGWCDAPLSGLFGTPMPVSVSLARSSDADTERDPVGARADIEDEDVLNALSGDLQGLGFLEPERGTSCDGPQGAMPPMPPMSAPNTQIGRPAPALKKSTGLDTTLPEFRPKITADDDYAKSGMHACMYPEMYAAADYEADYTHLGKGVVYAEPVTHSAVQECYGNAHYSHAKDDHENGTVLGTVMHQPAAQAHISAPSAVGVPIASAAVMGAQKYPFGISPSTAMPPWRMVDDNMWRRFAPSDSKAPLHSTGSVQHRGAEVEGTPLSTPQYTYTGTVVQAKPALDYADGVPYGYEEHKWDSTTHEDPIAMLTRSSDVQLGISHHDKASRNSPELMAAQYEADLIKQYETQYCNEADQAGQRDVHYGHHHQQQHQQQQQADAPSFAPIHVGATGRPIGGKKGARVNFSGKKGIHAGGFKGRKGNAERGLKGGHVNGTPIVAAKRRSDLPEGGDAVPRDFW